MTTRPAAITTHAAQPMSPAMELALSASFGSADRWRDEFVAMGTAPDDGPDWLLLAFQPRDARLVLQRVEDPDRPDDGTIALMALDMGPDTAPDHGDAAPGSRVDRFVREIDWSQVHERYRLAVDRASDDLGATAGQAGGARLIDVRRAGVFEQADAMAAGAEWRDPATVDAWAAGLRGQGLVVVYCVHGHEVSRAAATRLRAAQVDARFLVGGLEGWRTQGRALVGKAAATRT